MIPFINRGGAAFTSMRCVCVQGRSKIKDGTWNQTYTLTFRACASDAIQDVLQTACGSLKSAPLQELDMRIGFYPEQGETFTASASVAVSILDLEPTQIQLVAKIERKPDSDGNFDMTLDTFAGWLEQHGAVVLRPQTCDDTVDMFEDGTIPPLTVHNPYSDPVETTSTGDDLMMVLRQGLDPDDVLDFVGCKDDDLNANRKKTFGECWVDAIIASSVGGADGGGE